MSSIAQEYKRPFCGTPCDDKRAKTRGPTPFLDKPYNILPVEYMPLLAEDKAEVSTTKLIMVAAAPIPIMVNMLTKGLRSGATIFHGVTVMIMDNAST